MKPAHYYYSKKQQEVTSTLNMFTSSKRGVNEVFINGKFVPYTEMQTTKDHGSNWDDAVYLGVAPCWWIKVNNVIQDEDLAEYLLPEEENK